MTVAKVGAANVWVEPPAPAATLPIRAFLQLNGSSELVPAATGQQDASLVDWHNAGVEYECVLTGAPLVQIDGGGGVVVVATSGTPIAILIDDGAGGLVASTDLTQTPAGAYYYAANGSVVAARFDAPQETFVKSGDNYAAIP